MLKKVVVVVPRMTTTGNLSSNAIEEQFEAKGRELTIINNERGELIINDVKENSKEEQERSGRQIVIETLATFKKWAYWKKLE